jgi:hypothetical protein
LLLKPYKAYSIDLYAINLKNMDVPDQNIQIAAGNCRIRQTMRDEVALSAFGCCSWAGLVKMANVSPQTVKQNFDPESRNLSGWGDAMVDHIALSEDSLQS